MQPQLDQTHPVRNKYVKYSKYVKYVKYVKYTRRSHFPHSHCLYKSVTRRNGYCFGSSKTKKFHKGTARIWRLVASKPLVNDRHVSYMQKFSSKICAICKIFNLTAPPARSLYTTMGSGGRYASASRIVANNVVVFPPERRIKAAKSNGGGAGGFCGMGGPI